MSRKKKNRRISSESRTCFIFAAVFLVVGIAAVIHGSLFYHSDNMVDIDDIVTGQTATVVSVERRERNLAPSDREREKKKGYSDDELRWEYNVVYSVEDDGEEYRYDKTVRYHDDGKNTPREGDTEVINYAIKDGRFIPDPETKGTNGSIICGWGLIIFSVIAAGAGFFLRK